MFHVRFFDVVDGGGGGGIWATGVGAAAGSNNSSLANEKLDHLVKYININSLIDS